MSARRNAEPDDRAVYIISVAAELAGVHPQTLRIYERKGLLTPARTAGNTRRYSDRDIARLQTIQRLTQKQGLNLAGVKMIVQMEDELERMRGRMDRLGREMERARRRMQDEIERLRRESRRAEMVPLSAVQRLAAQVRAGAPPGAKRKGNQPTRRGPIAMGSGEV